MGALRTVCVLIVCGTLRELIAVHNLAELVGAEDANAQAQARNVILRDVAARGRTALRKLAQAAG